MNPLRRLLGQTAIYGVSSIVGRVLNYLLTPLYVRVFNPEQFGVNTEMYAYVSFLIIILTYGLETAYFRFCQLEENKDRVFSTAFTSIFVSSSAFIIMLLLLSPLLSETIGYTEHPEYIRWFAIIIGVDAMTAIPFARLREQGKAEKFALLRFSNIVVNIGLNLFFLVYCPYILKEHPGEQADLIRKIYNPEIGIGYVFISNLIATLFTFVSLLPDVFSVRFTFDKLLWRRMMIYGLPLLVYGLAGMTNETMDRILLKYLLPEDVRLRELGIYGACYKISVMMTIFIQAFRFAAEPFFFAESKSKDSKRTYAKVMKFFIITGCFIFLGITLFMNIVKFFVGGKGSEFHEGLHVVPVLLMANLFLGAYYNLSIWFKLTGKTRYGALLAIVGAVITLGLNIWWIPIFSYTGSAWATLICYVVITVLSYLIGQQYFPVNYPVKKMLFYIALTLVLYALHRLIEPSSTVAEMSMNFFLLLVFLVVVAALERPKRKVMLSGLGSRR